MRIEDIQYDQEGHFYYEVLSKANRASYQEDIDRFLRFPNTAGEGFIWVDIFNRLGKCKELPREWAKARQQLFQFIGHPTMLHIINKYAITDEDKEMADKAMRTFKREFSELVRPHASFSVRCRYFVGL